MTPRLERRVRRDFPDSQVVGRLVEAVHERERIQAAVVLAGRGDEQRLREAIALARLDWRDLLVNEGLADAEWPRTLDRMLGPVVEKRQAWRRYLRSQ